MKPRDLSEMAIRAHQDPKRLYGPSPTEAFTDPEIQRLWEERLPAWMFRMLADEAGRLQRHLQEARNPDEAKHLLIDSLISAYIVGGQDNPSLLSKFPIPWQYRLLRWREKLSFRKP